MDSKTCFKCERAKPLAEFYRHPAMADGHLGKCIECTKRDTRQHYAATRPARRAYDRLRSQRPERKRRQAQSLKRRRRQHPERFRARNIVSAALRDGRVARPSRCQGCRRPVKLQAHHPDYQRPLLVEWLCFKCHRQDRHGQTIVSSF